MMFWILIAVMTAAAALSILVPLARSARREDPVEAEQTADTAVYRQQLAEVDRDLERGLIETEAAVAARTEIARRLLAADERQHGAETGSKSGALLRLAMVTALVFLPLGSFGLYLYLGSPDLPDQPLFARLSEPAENQSVDVLVARVERHLSENPQDGQGWSVVAPVYMRMGNPKAAANAYANAIRLLGATAQLETDFGEALTVANDGIVSADAQAAFERAVALEPGAVKPRFFLALALGQEGKSEEAIASWSSLLEGADPSEAWVPVAQAELAKLGGTQMAGRLGSGEALPGPSAEEVAAASDMTDQDRTAMISGMVEGLAERLDDTGGSVDEWLRLIRAYSVLGEGDKAAAALTKARKVFAEDTSSLGRINEMAEKAGIEGS
ncbi:c-type cytochrome biogenesis protein CcmI [Roseibium polysiphoniae]|uniref:C-type cytochrome biogenesis protein CcmI n=1 Tax=Roseibium polysiphoniae TaxID=2571221 RepID=A0ABR9C4U0_9HYPH|nr:c-type cytochrome biogenesis protein CcmI [Roseibium polysiphoniae]MBD8874878.1 c-type cytochrome biogenesis protein CcmI [Roseibium polysiphoniae]